MAIFSALLSLLSRKIGDLLQALFGWSIAGLFGRLPSNKQTALSVALILSIIWPLLVVGCFLPKLAAWAVAFIPLHEWLGDTLLRAVWICLAAISPIIVGLIIAWVAPSHKQKGGMLRTVISGFPLTIGLFISFLLTFIIVPVLKLVAMAKRWEDEHVYLQAKEGQYLTVVQNLADACRRAGIPVENRPLSKFMQAPTRVLKFFARSSLDSLVASDPRMLRGDGVEMYMYPTDLVIRGVTKRTRQVRAAMVREMMESPAYLTEDGKAQELEDEINRTWDMLKRHRPDEARTAIKNRIKDAVEALDKIDVPYSDWMLLYTNLHRIERAVTGEPRLVDEQTSPTPQEAAMTAMDPHPELSTIELMKEAVNEARELLKTEIALARNEAKQEIAAVKRVAIAAGAAVLAAILGLSMMLVTMVLAIGPTPLTAGLTGGGLLVVAIIAGFVGYSSLPKKPLEQTQERLKADAQILTERLA